MSTGYEDIINRKRPESIKHKRMSNYERAAQFSAFAALTGYEAAVKEAARLTEERLEISDEAAALLNDKLALLRHKLHNGTIDITVRYFVKDELKQGGSYKLYNGTLRTIDDYNRNLVMQDKTIIPINNIADIESDIFRELI